MNPIWRPITGYEGLYEVSDQGEVIRLPRQQKFGNAVLSFPACILIQEIHIAGYKRVTLYKKDHKRLHQFVHRLVAQGFIENPEGLPIVNHKDRNRFNNSVSNLEFVTAHGNQIHWREDVKRTLRSSVPVVDISADEIIASW